MRMAWMSNSDERSLGCDNTWHQSRSCMSQLACCSWVPSPRDRIPREHKQYCGFKQQYCGLGVVRAKSILVPRS